jgi:hypothetical protein
MKVVQHTASPPGMGSHPGPCRIPAVTMSSSAGQLFRRYAIGELGLGC